MNKFFLIQIVSLMICVAVITIFFSNKTALYFTLGFLTLLLPNTIFAIKLTLLNKANVNPETKLLFFYFSQAVKLLIVVLLMLIFFKFYHPINWLTYLTGILISLKVVYFFPLFIKEKTELQSSSCKK